MRAKAIDVEETQTVFEWVEFEDDHEPYFFGVLELQNGQLLYGIFGEDVDTNEYASPLALARNADVAKQIANILNGAIAKLATVSYELEKTQHELAIWKPLLTAVCIIATKRKKDTGKAIIDLVDTAMALAEGSDSVYEGVENDYDMNLRKDALNRVCDQLHVSRFEWE